MRCIPADAAADVTLSEARVNRAWALDRMNRRSEALAACDAALEGDGAHALAHFNAATDLSCHGGL
ncbi:MAG: hypothetical protein WDN04_16935 [Rhodospirillales bacterium]